MVETRNVISGVKVGQQARSAQAETEKGEYKTACEAIKELRGVFPDLTFQDALRILQDCGLDVQRATAAVRKGRQPVVMIGEEVKQNFHDPLKIVTASVRRSGNNLSNEGRAKTGEPPKPAIASVGRGGNGNQVGSDSEEPPRGAAGIHIHGGNALRDGIKAKSDEHLKPAMAQANRPRNFVKQKAPDLSTAHRDIVEIIVGKDNPENFMVHKSFLCHASPYFKAAFDKQSPFVESKTQQMTIDFTTPKIFGLFQKWVYSKKHIKKITDDNDEVPPVMDLIELWVFGAKVHTPPLQNLALRGFYGASFATAPSSFRWLYSNTCPQSPLRRLFIDSVVCRKMNQATLSNLLDHHWDQVPQELMKDMMVGLKKTTRVAASGSQLPLLKFEDYLVPE